MKKFVNECINKWIESGILNELEEDMLKAICNGTFREHVIDAVKSRHPLEVFSTFNRLVEKEVIFPRKEADIVLIADVDDVDCLIVANLNE